MEALGYLFFDLHKAESHQAKKGLCMLKFSDINVCYLGNKACVIYVGPPPRAEGCAAPGRHHVEYLTTVDF